MKLGFKFHLLPTVEGFQIQISCKAHTQYSTSRPVTCEASETNSALKDYEQTAWKIN